MKSLLAGLTSLPFIAGFALAAQPVPLNDVQMDAAIAGANASNAVLNPITVNDPNPITSSCSFIRPCTVTSTAVYPAPGVYNGCVDCNFPPPPPPPPPPPTPTQQFSSLLSSNGIGLR